MDKLTSINGYVLSIGLDNLVPKTKGNRIERKLLDGTTHVQTIGAAEKEIFFRIFAYHSESETINQYWFEGASVKVYYDDVIYTGKISAVPTWTTNVRGERGNRVLIANLAVSVSSEGII